MACEFIANSVLIDVIIVKEKIQLYIVKKDIKHIITSV